MGLPTAWGEIYRHQRYLSSVFVTVGDADTPWHPQFFTAVTFESLRLTENGATVDPSDGPRHGDVRIGEPREPVFRFSSRLRLVHHVACPGMSLLCAGLGFPHETTICSVSAISQQCGTVLMLQHRAIAVQTEGGVQAHLLASDLVSGGGERTDGIDGGQVSAGTAPSMRAHRGILSFAAKMFIVHMFRHFLSWYGIDCERGQVVCQQPRWV